MPTDQPPGDPGSLGGLLDRLAGGMGAHRWVVCWRDGADWVAHSGTPSGRDDLLVRLAPELAGAGGASLVQTSDLGDPGIRLEAAGVSSLFTASSEDAGAVLALENPDGERVETAARLPMDDLPALCREVLRSKRWASELHVLLDLYPRLADVAFRGAPEAAALGALGEMTGHSALLVLSPLPRGLAVTGVRATEDGWVGREATLSDPSWDEAWVDPEPVLRAASTDVELEPDLPWTVGRARAFEPPVILGLAGRPGLLSSQGADVFATVVARTREDSRLAASTRQSTLLQERARIASLMHEGITQVLTNVAIQLEVLDQVLEEPDQAREMIRGSRGAVLEALDTLRGAVFEMSPAVPEWSDLAGGLERYVADYGSQWGLALTYLVEGPPREVPAEIMALAFAVVQEGLTNLRKHARTTRGEVRLRFGDRWLSLAVCDPGVGFDPAEGERRGFRQHQGLALTRARVRSMGGTFEVRSRPGEGTCMSMRVPA